MKDISVIIPTYNREDILSKNLISFINQDYQPDRYEILVIDDGSTDRTEKVVEDIASTSDVPIFYIFQENKGPAAARNTGIKSCSGALVLIVNADIIATPTLISEHIRFHKLYPDDNVGVLGFVTWSPEIEITSFMQWLEHGGPQFSYHKIRGREAGWRCFWTCNVSLKRRFLSAHGLFDEEFPAAAWGRMSN